MRHPTGCLGPPAAAGQGFPKRSSQCKELVANGEVNGPELISVARDAVESPIVDIKAESTPVSILFLGMHCQDLGTNGIREVNGIAALCPKADRWSWQGNLQCLVASWYQLISVQINLADAESQLPVIKDYIKMLLRLSHLTHYEAKLPTYLFTWLLPALNPQIEDETSGERWITRAK